VAREAVERAASAGADGLPRRPTRNVAAYDLYRRGSDRARLRNDSAAREGLELLRQAVALDSNYAAAWAGLALMHHRVGLIENGPTRSRGARARHHRLARAAAGRALVLDDSLAEAHLMMAKVHMVEFGLDSAERALARALALDPTLAEPHVFLVSLHLWRARPSDALAHAHRAVALDPLSPAAHAEVARALLGLDRCDEALATLEALSRLRPPLLRVADIAAQCYARQRRWPAAIAALRAQAEGGSPTALAQTGYLLARAGRRDDARRIHAALRERWRRGDGGAFPVGLVSAGLGDLDDAVAWFERAIEDRSLQGGPGTPGHLMLVLPGPLSDDLRRHPGFTRLRARLGLRER
jgi:tetratricopeptide (TPR) repeat protein